MFIWTGWGVLAGLIPFLMLVLADAALGNERYSSSSLYPAAAILVGAGLVFVVAQFLNKRADEKAREMTDKATGQTVVIRRGHTFFFIDIKWWPYILAVLAVISAVAIKPE